MISFTAVYGIVLRHLRLWKRDYNLILAGFYWPILDILTWGFLASWISKSNISVPNYETVALLGVLLWQIVGRGSNLLLFSFNEELWSNNIINLFSLPLKIGEWIIGAIVYSAIMIIMTSIICLATIFILYDVSVWNLISNFIIFFPLLFLSTIWISFLGLSTLTMFGKRGNEIGFVFGWFLMPFSGAYYPIEVLPKWAQTFSKFLPMSYAFQGMRAKLIYNQEATVYLIKSYLLSIVYLIIAISLFVYFFNRSKNKGLARLID